MEKYSDKLTSTTIKYKTVENPIAPLVTICTEPSFKPSFFEEHDVTSFADKSFFWRNGRGLEAFINVSDVKELFKEMTYELNNDWSIQYIQYNDLDWSKPKMPYVMLQEGKNDVDDIEVTPLPSTVYGMCYKIHIKPKAKLFQLIIHTMHKMENSSKKAGIG